MAPIRLGQLWAILFGSWLVDPAPLESSTRMMMAHAADEAAKVEEEAHRWGLETGGYRVIQV
jgi:hypothetical protein